MEIDLLGIESAGFDVFEGREVEEKEKRKAEGAMRTYGFQI